MAVLYWLEQNMRLGYPKNLRQVLGILVSSSRQGLRELTSLAGSVLRAWGMTF